MFGRKQIKVKEEKDEELMMLVYRVRDQMAAQRKLVATFREVDDQPKLRLNKLRSSGISNSQVLEPASL